MILDINSSCQLKLGAIEQRSGSNGNATRFIARFKDQDWRCDKLLEFEASG